MFEITHTKKNGNPVNKITKEKIVYALTKHLFNISKYCASY